MEVVAAEVVAMEVAAAEQQAVQEVVAAVQEAADAALASRLCRCRCLAIVAATQAIPLQECRLAEWVTCTAQWQVRLVRKLVELVADCSANVDLAEAADACLASADSAAVGLPANSVVDANLVVDADLAVAVVSLANLAISPAPDSTLTAVLSLTPLKLKVQALEWLHLTPTLTTRLVVHVTSSRRSHQRLDTSRSA